MFAYAPEWRDPSKLEEKHLLSLVLVIMDLHLQRAITRSKSSHSNVGIRVELGLDLRVRYGRRSGLLATSGFWYACQTYHRSPVATSSIISHDLQRTEHVAWAKLETLVMGEDNP